MNRERKLNESSTKWDNFCVWKRNKNTHFY